MFRPNSAAPAAEPLSPLSDCESDDVFSLFKNYDSVLIAVSGGSDSMALLLLADEWRVRGSHPVRFMVASVDHRLRRASAEECRFVANFCEARSVPHVTLTWEGTKPVTGLQKAARYARYALLANAAALRRCAAIATGHTQDDQAETVLMRLARGSGLNGLQGMAAVSQKNGMPLLRPLLNVPRERLRASLVASRVQWRDDSSNEDSRFLRPRLRRLLPQLAQEGLDAARLGKFARKAARVNEALDFAAQAILETARDACLARADYRQAPTEIRLRVLQKIIAALGTSIYPPGDEQLEDLDAALTAPNDARRTLGGVLFSAGQRFLRFSAENDSRKSSV